MESQRIKTLFFILLSMLFLTYNKALYIFEYQDDGYTKSGIRLMAKNSRGYTLVYLRKSENKLYSFITRTLYYARY